PIYLRHRATSGDAWQEPPSMSLLYPSIPAGAVPATRVTIEQSTEEETPCGCPGTSTAQDHLALKVTMPPIPLVSSASFINYLLAYNQATLHEAKMSRYGAGTYKTASISNIQAREVAGEAVISFRLATPIATAIS
ncbi:MAG TPA: hypothetical protein VFH43_03110, partial [Candidatus Kapabacteria bacterium]|nr:hypothetical protein [Candidatus Kapabacteria bacterium]